jgi:carotenoid cleavage dioxygenase-like enzyme
MTIADDQADLSPYLRGNYAPVADELDVDDLPITGALPGALDGRYLRNGPNPAFPPIGRYHLFDGDGMLHGVELRGGRASYRNRWVRSKGLDAELRAGRALYGGLSELVAPDPALVGDAGGFKNTANTNIVRHAGRHLALLEAGLPTEVTTDLETVGEYDFSGALEGPMTAHPKCDAATGELLFFGYSAVPPHLRYHVADGSGRLVRSVDVDLPRSVMMHDFVVTQRWAVFFDLPAVFDLEAMFAGGPIISWRPELPARIGLLDRSGEGDVRWFELEPFYVFHFLNGFDTDDGRVVVDGCRAPHLPITFGDEVLAPCLPTMHRWTIDPAAGTVAEEQLDDRFGDFPRIDDAGNGRPTRYGYMAHASMEGDGPTQFTGVVKYDLTTGGASVHEYGPGREGGEAVFAPDPDGSAEDDGWLLNIVHDRAEGTSELVVLDARDLAARPVARVHLPRRVPVGFHGNWMAD